MYNHFLQIFKSFNSFRINQINWNESYPKQLTHVYSQRKGTSKANYQNLHLNCFQLSKQRIPEVCIEVFACLVDGNLNWWLAEVTGILLLDEDSRDVQIWTFSFAEKNKAFMCQ